MERYKHMGAYTGELLRADIEQRSCLGKIHLVCYFAHDSTLASFYYAFGLDKHCLLMPEAKFCSYYSVESTQIGSLVTRTISFIDHFNE